MTLNPKHQHNITEKAQRAITAIDSLIANRLVADPGFPVVTDLATGRAWMLDWLQEDDMESLELVVWAALWTSIGIEHDRLAGITSYGPGEHPTLFNTSRPTVLNLLDALVWQTTQPVAADPFAGLDGSPVANPF